MYKVVCSGGCGRDMDLQEWTVGQDVWCEDCFKHGIVTDLTTGQTYPARRMQVSISLERLRALEHIKASAQMMLEVEPSDNCRLLPFWQALQDRISQLERIDGPPPPAQT